MIVLRWIANSDVMDASALLFGVLTAALLVSVDAETAHYDVVNPIVTKGPDDSLFGYSVALHTNGNQKYAIIGAPRSEVFPAVQRVRGVSRPGAVYKCPLMSASTSIGPCQQIAVDSLPDRKHRNGSKVEIKSNMRLGTTVMSEGSDGRVVVCAPSYKTVWFYRLGGRFSKGQELDDAVGRCFILPKDLSTEQIVRFSPCDNIPHYVKFLPGLLNTWLRFCLVGTSIDITKGPNNRNQMVLGAPGRQLGVGQIWTGDLGLGNVPPFTSGILHADNVDNYTGMAVAQADFDGDNELEVALSQPMYGVRKEGGVLIVPAQARIGPITDHRVRSKMEYVHIAGAFMGENFGYSMCAVDVTNDGIPELFVGAPLARSSSVSRSVFENGHVYVFSGQAIRAAVTLGKKSNPATILNASSAARTLLGEAQAWFGAAVSSLGDINADGFNDVAVGAPYETIDGKQQGAVYIYLGAADGLRTQFIQKISAVEMTMNAFEGLGFSLGRGLDFDGNSYNDLVMGSPFTSQAIVLRARPTVAASFDIASRSESAGNCFVGGTTVRCVNISICGTLTSGVLRHGRATYNVDVRTSSVLSFDPQNAFIDEGTVTVTLRNTSPGQRQQCRLQSLYLTSNNKICSSTSVTLVSWALKSEDSTPEELTAIENLPVPDQQEKIIEVDLVTQCPTCTPDLKVDGVTLTGMGGEQRIVIGRNRQVRLSASITNVGTKEVCTGTVTVFLGDHLSFGSLENGDSRRCREDNEARTVTCLLPPGQARNVATDFKFVLNVPKDLDSNTRDIAVRVGASPDARQDADLDSATMQSISVVRRASIEVSAEATSSQLELKQNVPPKPQIKDLGPELKHDFRVNNVGPSQVPSSDVFIEWPASLKTGTYLLYLTSVTSSDSNTRCNASQLINHRNYASATSTSATNVAQFTSGPKALPYNSARKCTRPGLVCFIGIMCEIPEMAAGAATVVSLTWRVYSSLTEDERLEYPITANSSIKLLGIDTAPGFTKEESKRPMAMTTTTLFAVFEPLKEGVKWWVILLAVLAGVFILALCILILCKCGFFKRKRPPSD
ncbi:integrin alpha-7-like [Sycon ciliatum]|uniref:integrin alpha-7-like n=1 Tax=Sycon ciliatum TaxID=27933 RepID=UPI0031F68C34